MAIYYAHDEQGAFIAGDSVSGRTCYAYPTSVHADTAKKNAVRVAQRMVDQDEAIAFTHAHAAAFADYDRRNWQRLHDLHSDHTTRAIIDAVIHRI